MLQAPDSRSTSGNGYANLNLRNSSTPDLKPPQTSKQRSSSAGPSLQSRSAADGPGRASAVGAALSKPLPTPPDSPAGKLKRKSWNPGWRKDGTKIKENHSPAAWIAGRPGKQAYNLTPLLSDFPVPELWDEHGDTLIHLSSRDSGKGPSFRIKSSLFASSPALIALSQAALLDDTQSHAPTSSKYTCNSLLLRSGPLDLYLDSSSPLDKSPSQNGLDARVALRNLFAFLLGEALVATSRRNTSFDIFLSISQLLTKYGFTNIDGSTYGEVSAASFERYVEELGLHKIQSSREKTIEALVLSERMRSTALYNEAFTHAAGNYSGIQNILSSPEASAKFNLVSSATRSRLERASIDVSQRVKSVNARLLDFEFPSLFAGVMNSKKISERKYIQFDAWKAGFAATRRHVLTYYRKQFGSWPPKANSKKNDLEIDGLNRLVLKTLYDDFCSMYDLYVDRKSLTTRSNVALEYTPAEEIKSSDDPEDSVPRILRRVFDEYDRSSPPVQPPIPFDVPILPNLIPISQELGLADSERSPKIRNKKLSEDQINRILAMSCNRESKPASANGSPFLASICAFELNQARGCSIAELVDLRAGMWIFMYAVIQALPMLVVDAPGLRCHGEVEYFLCQPPRGSLPWIEPSTQGHTRRRSDMNWYSIPGGKGIVSLPSDLVEHGVEGIYRRSHCWKMASIWTEHDSVAIGYARKESSESQRRGRTIEKQLHRSSESASRPFAGHPRTEITEPSTGSPIPVSRSVPSSRTSSRVASPGIASRLPLAAEIENPISLGLQALPVPPGIPLMNGPIAPFSGTQNSPRVTKSKVGSSQGLHSSGDAAKVALTFDDILGTMNNAKKDKTTKIPSK